MPLDKLICLSRGAGFNLCTDNIVFNEQLRVSFQHAEKTPFTPQSGLAVNQLVINDFLRAVADRIHLLNPQHLIVSFKLFRHALTLCELPYQPIKHILRLLVNIGEISGQLAFGQQICVEDFTVA